MSNTATQTPEITAEAEDIKRIADDQARLWVELRREFDAIDNDTFVAGQKRFENLKKTYFIVEL